MDHGPYIHSLASPPPSLSFLSEVVIDRTSKSKDYLTPLSVSHTRSHTHTHTHCLFLSHLFIHTLCCHHEYFRSMLVLDQTSVGWQAFGQRRGRGRLWIKWEHDVSCVFQEKNPLAATCVKKPLPASSISTDTLRCTQVSFFLFFFCSFFEGGRYFPEGIVQGLLMHK